MLTSLCLSVVLAAGPVEVPHLGFSVEVVAGAPVVRTVTPDGVAAKAGLRAGMVLVREAMPRAVELKGLSTEEVVAKLTVPPGEALRLAALEGDRSRSFMMMRTDPIPEPEFPVMPLPPEELKALTPMRMARYFVALQQFQLRPRRTPSASLRATGNLGVVASFEKGGSRLVSVYGGGATPKFIAATLQLSADCVSSPLLGLDVAGDAPGLPFTVAPRPGSEATALEVERPLLLWRVEAAASACAAGTLASAPVTLTLRCQSGPVKVEPVTVPLKVECNGPSITVWGAMLTESMPSLDPNRLVVGGPATVAVRFTAGRLVPRPPSLTPVVLDETGRVVSRLSPLPLPAEGGEDELRTTLTVPLTKPGVLRVAFEASYPDGSTARSLEAPLIVETREAEERRAKAFATGGASHAAFRKKLEASGKGCADPKALLAWLKAQPEVQSAAEIDGDVSFVLAAFPVGNVVHCHASGY